MTERLLVLGCALALFAGCGGNSGGGTDAGSSGTDAPMPTGCVGDDGTTPCLRIGSASAPMEPNLTCLGTVTAPEAGATSDRTLRLVAYGTSTTPIPNGEFSVWTNNMVPADPSTCGSDANCIALTSGADGTVTASLAGSWFAYHVPANAAAMTYEAIGYNRTPPGAGDSSDVVTIPSSLFNTAIGLVRSGFMRDPTKGIMTGDVADCDGENMRGVTVRLFQGDTEIVPGTAPTDPGLAYRANGVLPDARMRTTDYSGGYAAANLPTGSVRIEAYGVVTEGGPVELISCEEVSLGANAITIVSVGPTRGDYPLGSGCAGR